ncbi:MAG: endo-1,4-beta-xylanase, partial [Spirochaetota bacterium]
VTELDLALEDDAEQAARMEELVTLFAAHRAVRGITLWGYKEEWIYSKSAHLLSADGEERPALTWLREFRGR